MKRLFIWFLFLFLSVDIYASNEPVKGQFKLDFHLHKAAASSCDTVLCPYGQSQWQNGDNLYFAEAYFNIYRRTFSLVSGGNACDTLFCPYGQSQWANSDNLYFAVALYNIYLRSFHSSGGGGGFQLVINRKHRHNRWDKLPWY